MGIWELVYPKRCVGCGSRGQYICAICAKSITRLGNSLRYQGVVRQVIKEIKYRGVYQMVEELVERWDPEKPSEFDLDLVVTSVPMWRQKIKSRGFNQAQLMAVALARKWGLTYLEIIERERETKPMYGLNKRERLDNVKNAFRPRENVSEPALAKMSGVILVDDVWTSGATLEECARSIRGKWRVKVLPMAVAR